MRNPSQPHPITEVARERGPIRGGRWRVIVIESDARVTHIDFATLGEAVGYADDAASETDDRPPLAYVLNDSFELVHEGRPYAAG